MRHSDCGHASAASPFAICQRSAAAWRAHVLPATANLRSAYLLHDCLAVGLLEALPCVEVVQGAVDDHMPLSGCVWVRVWQWVQHHAQGARCGCAAETRCGRHAQRLGCWAVWSLSSHLRGVACMG